MSNQRLTYLFARYVQGQCDAAEKRELSALALALQNETDLQQLLEQYWSEVKGEMVLPEERTKEMLVSILHGEVPVVSKEPRIRIKHWWAVAAVVLLLAAGGWFFLVRGPRSEVGSRGNGTETGVVADVEAPKTTKAVITLADGRQISLDSLTTLTQENVTVVKNENGAVVYSGHANEIIYNTLVNPRGSKVVHLTLSDGTKVWLNSESSLKYPVAFTGNTRQVEITGEAYFEASSSPSKGGVLRPFIVKNGEMQVTVLGTHFNVNAYEDEQGIKVTLLEGSVKVASPNPSQGGALESVIIRPGQQARVTSTIKVNDGVDLEQVMAWKNGKFQFIDASIEAIMNQVARWYNAEIVYEGKIPGEFVAEISRDLPVSKLLQIMELTNRVHFEIDSDKKKIIVRP